MRLDIGGLKSDAFEYATGGGGGGNSGQAMMMMMMAQQAEQRRLDNEARARTEAIDFVNNENARMQQERLAENNRRYDVEDRDLRNTREDTALRHEEDLKAQAKQEAADKLAAWQGTRQSVFSGAQNDADALLSAKGIHDPSVRSAIMSALTTANAGIADNDPSVAAAFAGIADKVLGQQTDAARARAGASLNAILPTGFETTRVDDTVDDSILEGILGEQYNDAAAQAKRLLDRGVITDEGYQANLKGLNTQKNTARSRLTTLGNNELNAERTRLGAIGNKGRAAASTLELGGPMFDAATYGNEVNSAYDKWFGGLDTTLRGIAPTDLFDTSGFLNTAGSVSGPRNSPFAGSINALTGDDANYDKKKTPSNGMGVF